ncbi:MAG: phosphodiester glycosidase family protein [bacterium]|nr:phosphodiester glycosidase family protein [bacterium]
MKKIALLFLSVLAMSAFGYGASSKIASPKGEKWYDTRAYKLVFVRARFAGGETVASMIKYGREELGLRVVFGINGGYFGQVRRNGCVVRFGIGLFMVDGIDLSECPAPVNRGRICQTDGGVVIAFKIPEGCDSAIEGGPILLLDGHILRDYQGFTKAHWNRKCLRTVIATKGKHTVYLLRFYDSLWNVQKWLKRNGFDDASNLDGGSSSEPWAKVRNAVLVCRIKPWNQEIKGTKVHSSPTPAGQFFKDSWIWGTTKKPDDLYFPFWQK